MDERKAKVYWFTKPGDEKDILIFDAGHFGGDIYIYEHKATLPAIKLEEQLKLFGHHQAWDIVYPGDPVLLERTCTS